MRVSIQKKLSISFFIVACLVGILGVVGYSTMRETANQVDVMTTQEIPGLVKLGQMKSRILEAVEEAFAYPLLNDLSEKSEFFENLNHFDILTSEYFEIAKIGSLEQREETLIFNQIVTARIALETAADHMFKGYERDGAVSLSAVIGFEDEIDNVIPLIDRLLSIENDEVAELHEIINQRNEDSEKLTLIVVSVAMLLAVILGILVSRSIAKPLNKLKDAALRIGAGELDTLIDIRSNDELGELAASFNGMAVSLHQAQEQRGALFEELEQKNTNLEVAYKELQTLDAMKDELISTVSHELRTPLTSIKGAAEILLNYRDVDPETELEFLGIINSESDRLTRLINDVLDLARMESGEIEWHISKVDLPSIIETAVDGTHAITVQKNVTVEIGPGDRLPVVNSDPDKLVQVVTNLLSNAIKFTPSGGLIHVKSRLTAQAGPGNGGRMAEVSVADNGVGIPEIEFESIFNRFQQAGSTLSDRPQGTGLGLAICKEIVQHLGGDIWVESELGKGSTFFFTVPVADVSH